MGTVNNKQKGNSMIFKNCNEVMNDLIKKTPEGKITSNIPIPAAIYKSSGGFQMPLEGGTRDILYTMNIGDFVKVKSIHAHRYGVGSYSYGDGWSVIKRKVSNDYMGIWKVEREGYKGARIRTLEKNGRLEEYRDLMNEIYD